MLSENKGWVECDVSLIVIQRFSESSEKCSFTCWLRSLSFICGGKIIMHAGHFELVSSPFAAVDCNRSLLLLEGSLSAVDGYGDGECRLKERENFRKRCSSMDVELPRSLFWVRCRFGLGTIPISSITSRSCRQVFRGVRLSRLLV